MSRRRVLRPESGWISLEFLAAVGMSFVVLVFLTNFIVIQYGMGVTRAAADEGARAGSRVAANPEVLCQQRADATLSGMGSLADNVSATCAVQGTSIVATVHAEFKPWLPIIPTISKDAVGSSMQENELAPVGSQLVTQP